MDYAISFSWKKFSIYVLGHAICEGYIDSINITLDDWSVLDGTLYKGQKLIDILNMKQVIKNLLERENLILIIKFKT